MSGAVYPDLRGKRILVTGGATGIGRRVVEAFLAQGASVAAIDIDAGAIAALTAAHPGAALRVHRADLTDAGARAEAFAACGPCDVLIANAADDTRHAWDTLDEAGWRRALAINLDHQFFAAQWAARAMTDAKRGTIVLMGSVAARRGWPAMAGYLTAKAGAEGLVRALARELGPSGVRVVGVVPGAIETERQTRLWQTPDRVPQILAAQAIPVRLDGGDVARLILFLSSDEARGCTAHSYVVDAGLV
ncbi:MAG: SDR family oxidoreductase [Tagaea sp.]|nr:SDR family oxidoreductase [Tagaea sp.]